PHVVAARAPLFGLGGVAAEETLVFLSQNAAGGVDVLARLLDSVLELRAEGGAAAGDRSGDPQLDLRRSVIRESEAEAEDQTKREPMFHSVHLWIGAGKARLESRARAVLGKIQPANKGNVTRILAYPRPAYRRGAASEIAPRVHGSICSG